MHAVIVAAIDEYLARHESTRLRRAGRRRDRAARGAPRPPRPVTYYPTLVDVAAIARRIGAPIRDLGLIESALARPRTNLFGADAYPDEWAKAAALLHSFVGNHPFVDGNKRMGWVVAVTFLLANGVITDLEIDQDDAYDLVIAVASGQLSDVAEIAHPAAQDLRLSGRRLRTRQPDSRRFGARRCHVRCRAVCRA